MVAARCGEPHRAGLPRAAGAAAQRQDRAVRDRHRRVLRAEAARTLRRAGRPPRAAGFAARGRLLARRHRRGGAQSSPLRPRRRPAGTVAGRMCAGAAVPERDFHRRRRALAACAEAAPARPRQFHPGTAAAAGSQRTAGTRVGRALTRAGRRGPFQLQRWPYAGADAGRNRRRRTHRRPAARRRGVLRRPDPGPFLGARAHHHGLRP